MLVRQNKLPLLWLLSDSRNDDLLENVLANLPEKSGFVFRHYHLEESLRAARFKVLAELARDAGHTIILAGNPDKARAWGADGVYGEARHVGDVSGLIRLTTAHDGAEVAAAQDADGIFLSPVFPTRSHPEAYTLGIHGFHVLAQQSAVPIIALGGMTKDRAQTLQWPRWGAIDGLVSTL